MSELKPLPCPFCGQTGLIFDDGSTHRWGIASCDGCGATTGEVRRDYPDDGEWHAEAIKKWNRRAQTAQAVPVYQDLRAMANAVWEQAEHEKAPEAFATGAAGSTERSSVLADMPILAQAVPLLTQGLTLARDIVAREAALIRDPIDRECLMRCVTNINKAIKHHGIVGKEGA